MKFSFNKSLRFSIYITFFFAWFSGISISLGSTNFTISALSGFVTIFLWLLKLITINKSKIILEKKTKKSIYYYLLFIITAFFSCL